MRKVYQTILDGGNGNCMQAVIASLLEKELEEVPNFIENYYSSPETYYKTDPLSFLKEQGYHLAGISGQGLQGEPPLRAIARIDGGIRGCFYASVPSATHKGGFHAVVVDTDLKVVHDPNPNGKCLNYTPDKIQYIITINDWKLNNDNSIVLGEDYKDYERINN